MTVYCVAKNYARHAQEMGSTTPAAPVWFLKPDAAIIHDGDAVRIPRGIGPVHHEVEWAVRIGDDGAPDAMTVAVDVTARGLQSQAKEAGHPWAVSKGIRSFLPMGPWVPFQDGPHELRLLLDDEVRQRGSTQDMSFGLQSLLTHLASWTDLRAGDIVLTGTPDGVGPIEPGQTMVAELVGQVRLRTPVVEA